MNIMIIRNHRYLMGVQNEKHNRHHNHCRDNYNYIIGGILLYSVPDFNCAFNYSF